MATAGFPTPLVRADGGPDCGLGRAFMVMDRAAGGPTPAGLLAALGRCAAETGRADLAGAARWLADHPPAPAPDVICHGDLHPFNLLADGDRVTVLDWSTAGSGRCSGYSAGC